MYSSKERLGQESGYTLMELLLTLSVIGILVSVGMNVFYSGKMLAETDGVAKLDDNLVNGIMEIYDAGDFTGLTTAKVIDLGIVPSSMIRTVAGAPAFIDYFGGNVIFSPFSVNGGTNNGVGINHPSVPRNRCATFVSDLENYFNLIYLNGNIVKPLNQPKVISGATGLAALCDAAGTKNIVAVRVP